MTFWITLMFLVVYVDISVHVRGQTTSNQRLYLLNFMDISRDRTTTVIQTVDIHSMDAMKLRMKIPAANIDRVISLDSGNNFLDKEVFDTDFEVKKGKAVTQSGGLLVSDSETTDNIPYIHVNRMEDGTTAGYRAWPVTKNSREFFIPSYGVEQSSGFHSGMGLAGIQDGSCVEIYKVNGNDYIRLDLIHLDQFDVYSAFEGSTDFDYTGIFVNSTRPIAAFGGHECAKIPLGKDFCDAIVEQVPPVIEWGTDFILGPIAGRTEKSAGYEFRVIAQDNDTEVTYKGSDGLNGNEIIHRGNYASAMTSDTTANVHVKCSKPCLVSQYNTGRTAVANEQTGTDPFMLIVTPLDHYTKKVVKFATMHQLVSNAIAEIDNYVTVIVETVHRDLMQLNREPFPSASTPLEVPWTTVADNPDYSTISFKVSPGNHELRNLNGNANFTATVYGHGSKNTAYGYTAVYEFFDDAIQDSSLYEIVDQTTQAPVTTAVPWIIDDVSTDLSQSDAEYPMYAIRFGADFSVFTRVGKIIETVCSTGYRDFLTDKRIPSMEEHLTVKMNIVCPGLEGANITLVANKSYDVFHTEYTRGRLSFVLSIRGSEKITLRQITQCSNNVKTYINDIKNWPPIGDNIVDTTEQNYLQKPMESCDEVKLGILTHEQEFYVLREAWICDGKTVEEILFVDDSASGVFCGYFFTFTMPILAALLTQIMR